MRKGIQLWGIWLVALTVGIYGTGLVYQGTIDEHPGRLIPGVPILLFGIWLTGNILASARKQYYLQKHQ